MAESGIKISQLQELTEPSPDDYTVVVQKSTQITKRAALNSIRGMFDSDAAEDSKRIKELVKEVAEIKISVDNLSDDYDDLSAKYISSSWESTLEDMAAILYGEDSGIDGGGIKADLTELYGIVERISASVKPLTADGFAETISKLVELLESDSGEMSLENLANRIYDNSEAIESINNTLPTVSRMALAAGKRLDALETDVGGDNYSYTAQNNKTYENKINPLNILLPSDDSDSSWIYDFYYDRNRFANIDPPKMEYYLSGYIDGDETQTTSFYLDYIPNDPYTTPDSTTITDITLVSATGLSIDNNGDVVRMYKGPNADWSDPVKDFDYGGDSTFNSEYGIPLRYGMLQPNEDDPLLSSMYIDITAASKIKLYLNKSPYITTAGKKSVLSIYFNDRLIGTKNSNVNAGSIAIEDSGDFNLYYSGNATVNDRIRIVAKMAETDSAAMSSTLFGMIVPMVNPSQLNEIEIGTPVITKNDNGDDTPITYTLNGDLFFGKTGKSVEISAYLSEDELTVDSLAEKSPIDTYQLKIDSVANEYEIDNINESDVESKGIYLFVTDPFTGHIVAYNSNPITIDVNSSDNSSVEFNSSDSDAESYSDNED